MSQLILKPDSPIHARFSQLIDAADRVFFAGLPGVGKSLLLQQLTLMALAAGRPAHLLQWDRARQPFESPEYPLKDGATHPLIIRAVGVWLREALVAWEAAHRASDCLLIGEMPLIGGRLMEIARPADDAAEALLRHERSQFVLPAPSKEVRDIIEARRERSIAQPQHEDEAQDAPPDLLRALWGDLHRVAVHLGLAENVDGEALYSPEIYAAVYRHLLQHRNVLTLAINEPLQPTASVYDFDAELPQLIASREQAQVILAQLAQATPASQEMEPKARWYDL